MNNFFTTIQEYLSVLLNPLVVLVVGILTVLVSKNSTKHHIALKRLTHAYHPIFLLAEPYLFKSVERSYASEFVEKYNEIELNYSLYIYPSLRQKVNLLSIALKGDCEQSTLDEYWMLICKYIDKDYDSLSKIAHMPTRSTAYRLNEKQFSSKTSLYWGMFKLLFLPLTLVYILCFILLILVGLTDFLSK